MGNMGVRRRGTQLQATCYSGMETDLCDCNEAMACLMHETELKQDVSVPWRAHAALTAQITMSPRSIRIRTLRRPNKLPEATPGINWQQAQSRAEAHQPVLGDAIDWRTVAPSSATPSRTRRR